MGRTIRRKVDKFTTFIGLHRRRKKAAPPDSGAEACDQGTAAVQATAKVPGPPRVAAREVMSLEDPPRQPPNWAAATAIQQDERRSVPEWTTAAADTDLVHQRAVPVQVEVVEVVEAEVVEVVEGVGGVVEVVEVAVGRAAVTEAVGGARGRDRP